MRRGERRGERSVRGVMPANLLAGDGTPTGLADGFGSHFLTLLQVRLNHFIRDQMIPLQIHPTGWVPRGSFAVGERGFGVRLRRR